MNNQRGGIISMFFIIPVGVALMIGFFLLGYYVGKYQEKPGEQSGIVLPLPDVVSRNLPTSDEFTFYKTLTEKDGKTVSIDLKYGPKKNGGVSEGRQTAHGSSKPVAAPSALSERKPENRSVKADAPPQQKGTPVKTQTITAKHEPVKAAPSNGTPRYTVQISAYQEKGMAEDEVRNMKKRGYAAFIASADLPEKGLWYRVRLGSFQSKASAEKLQKEILAKEGISTIVVIE